MKVIYDISCLGLGHRNLVHRTGIFRVVENIAYALAKSNACDLSFSASLRLNTLPVLMTCLEYLEANPVIGEVPLHYSNLKQFIDEKVEFLSNKIDNEQGLRRLLFKFTRKPFLYTSKALANSISHDSLANTDIFHSPCYPLPQEVKQVKSVNKFMTIHDLIPILYPKYCQNKVNTEFVQSVLDSIDDEDSVICVSYSTKNDLCNYSKSFDPSRVFVTHLAAAPDVFYPCTNSEEITSIRKKYSIPDAAYILSLCTLEPRKNIDHVIRCFAKLVQEQNIRDLYLVLVGVKGWSYDKIFEELANFDFAKDRIIITGYVADQDLAALYSGALAFTYLSFYEGFGLPPLEAMQCGIPVITSNNSSLPEVVGNAGIMLDPLDADGLCESMLELYSNSSLRESMSLKSIERAKEFSWEKCVEQTLSAYKASLSN